MNRYPQTPGFKQVGGTSQDAAIAIASRAGTLAKRVLAEIATRPGTADEIAFRMRESILSVRPRVSELARKGLVEATGERRVNASGMKADVYAVVAQRCAA